MQNKKNKVKLTQYRKCMVTGVRATKSELIRFVVSPNNFIIPDLKQNLPGRGMWLIPKKSAIEKAVRKGIFAKHIKKKVIVPEDIIWQLENLIVKTIISQISLARKAGKAVCGFKKVRMALSKEKYPLLIQASDGSPKELTRLGKLEKSVKCLDSYELGLAFGRESAIHCVILNSVFAQNILFNANRLNNLKKPLPQKISTDI